MNTRKRWPLRLLALVAVAGSVWAAPPTASFLTPDRHAANVGDVLPVRISTGAAPDAQPVRWPAAGVPWLFIRGGPAQENRHDARPARDQDNSVGVEIKHAGVTLIGADLRPTVTKVSGTELRTFAGQYVAGGDAVPELPADAAPLRVRQISSMKTLIRAVAEDGRLVPSAIGTSKTGQAVELRPLFDPTVVQAGSDLPLWVYINGSKRGGVKVQATHAGTGKGAAFTTDKGGSGYFRVTDPGLWRVEVHHLEPAVGDAAADWIIYSGTLTFEALESGGGR